MKQFIFLTLTAVFLSLAAKTEATALHDYDQGVVMLQKAHSIPFEIIATGNTLDGAHIIVQPLNSHYIAFLDDPLQPIAGLKACRNGCFVRCSYPVVTKLLSTAYCSEMRSTYQINKRSSATARNALMYPAS